jgi:hypothetical protein
MALPISGEVHRLAAPHCQRRYAAHLIAVRDATVSQTAEKHGLNETEAGITMKLKRGTFAATFFLACLAAMELEGVVLEEI